MLVPRGSNIIPLPWLRRRPPANGAEKPLVYPSELRSYVYCPRLLFFEQHMGRRRRLLERLNLFLKKVYHVLLQIPAMLRGFRVEETIELDMGSYVLRGRPDEYKIEGGKLRIIEIKTTKAPAEGAWLSDYLQAAAYAMILMHKEAVKEAYVEVKYMNREVRIQVKEEHLKLVRTAAEEVLAVKEGIVPFANRSERKCTICPYREVCLVLGDEMGEMGEWVSKNRFISY
ncbi:MAG: CRISPR-associated protein Cas4 [Acidilobaceae archaeon]|nr:CRISPR-associated protein Cas4 [Acidilobaceae archaeon]